MAFRERVERECGEESRRRDQARKIVRRALGEPSLELVLDACRSAVTSCFGAVGMWLTAFGVDGGTSMTSYSLGSDVDPQFSEIDDVVVRLAGLPGRNRGDLGSLRLEGHRGSSVTETVNEC